MVAERLAASAGLNADQLNLFVSDKFVKDSNCVRSATDARNYCCWKFALGFHDLRTSFSPNYSMKVTDHCRIGVRSQHAPQQIVSRADVGHPIAHGFIDCVF